MSEREWWEPVVTDEEWLAETRADYPDECAGLDDDDVREKYADGLKYQTLWDNLGDAREEHEALADAYLALRAEVERLKEAIEIEREGQRSMARAMNEINRLSRLDVAINLTAPAEEKGRDA